MVIEGKIIFRYSKVVWKYMCMYKNLTNLFFVSQSLLPTRLLAKLEREATSVLSVVDANGTKPALSTMSQENSSVQKCPGLLEAIESGFGGIISFTAFVLRIYRRKISVEDQQNRSEERLNPSYVQLHVHVSVG